jgi:hypothetical protein
MLKRLFGEERRRTKVIPHAFGERAVLKLMYVALIRAAERWRGLRMTEFERRQLTAIRRQGCTLAILGWETARGRKPQAKVSCARNGIMAKPYKHRRYKHDVRK